MEAVSAFGGFAGIFLCFWWIAASAFVANVANDKGAGGGKWFAAALFFSPILAAILLMSARWRDQP